jgi:hypothetical protein
MAFFHGLQSQAADDVGFFRKPVGDIFAPAEKFLTLYFPVQRHMGMILVFLLRHGHLSRVDGRPDDVILRR